MILDPPGLKPLFGTPHRGGADLVLGFKVDALALQGAVIYARVDVERRQSLVDMIGPRLAPALQQLGPIPVADLLPKALRANLTPRQHAMRLRLGLAVLRSEDQTSELQ